MAKKDSKHKKAVAHAQKMSEKQKDALFYEGVKAGCEFTLLMSYAALADGEKFDMARLGKYRKRMDRYSVYMKDDVLHKDELVKVLLDKGIDVTKIGDEYVSE